MIKVFKPHLRSMSIKMLLLIFVFYFSHHELLAQTTSGAFKSNALGGGIGLGVVLAVVLSWSRNQSVLWAIFHGILSWFYVIYFALTRNSH